MTIKTDNIQIGLDATPNNNYTLAIVDTNLTLAKGLPTLLGPTIASLNSSNSVFNGRIEFSNTISSGNLTVIGVSVFGGAITESTNIIATAPAAIQNYSDDKTIIYHTANTSSNFIINLNNLSAANIGSSRSYVILVSNGSTAYFSNTIYVNGSTTGVTTRWQSLPTAGNSNKVDSYNISVIKTSSNTYSVFAGQSNFG